MERDTYRMLVGVEESEMGPAIGAGTLVYLDSWIGSWASVIPHGGTESTFVEETVIELVEEDEL